MSPRQMNHEVVHYDLKRAVKDVNYARSIIEKPAFLSFHESFKAILGDHPDLTLVEQRDYQFAHEAGVYIRSTDSVYFTANLQATNPVHLYSVSSKDMAIQQHDFPEVIQANGACNYQDKILYCSQGDKNSPSGLVLVDPKTGESSTLITNYHGREFNSINDVVVHHETGDIWFTDPTYGYEQAIRPSPQLPSQVYRFKPSTGECWMVADGFSQCNGLCFSPDYKRMYITDTGAVQAHDGVGDGHQVYYNPRLPATIYEYDVLDSSKLANRRTFAFCDKGVPDGIKCDVDGNVYSGCDDGVHIWHPSGTLIGKILVGDTVANFNFVKGGIWMYGEKSLYFCSLKAKGALVHIECE